MRRKTTSFADNDLDMEDERIPGFTEYRYLAELLLEDGTTDYQIISVFVENEAV